MRLYMASTNRKITKYNKADNLVHFEGNNVIIGNQTFDIVSQKQELIKKIS
jgi:hypothetical protein